MDNKFVGDKIRQRRRALGLTQARLADEVGRTESSIAKYERGTTEIPMSVLEKIAATLKCNLDDLLPPDERLKRELGRLEPYWKFTDYLMSFGFAVDASKDDEIRLVELESGAVYELTGEQLAALADSVFAYTKFQMGELAKKKKSHAEPGQGKTNILA